MTWPLHLKRQIDICYYKATTLNIRTLFFGLASTFLLLMTSGCAINSVTKAEKRVKVLTMTYETLEQLYSQKPSVKEEIKQAAGYAVFDNANVNFIVASLGKGYGVVYNNHDNTKTYMKMAEAGLGFGAGVKDFSLVMIFNDQCSLKQFVDKGWAVGAQVDAGAKVGNQGGASGGELSVDNVTIYQITKNGLALQLTVKGTKFYKDDDLN